mmetsp:Transcript_14232/g.23256  ORF Transcript_14232/g.23256 Transcript_14232/m.23256 type:complete len:327 (+) Transcript_14232:649-1629(+)
MSTRKNKADSQESDRPDAERKLIDTYHTLEKKLLQEQRKLESLTGNEGKEAAQVKIKRLKKEMQEMGGLAAYQQASLNGEVAGGGFDSSRWVLEELEGRIPFGVKSVKLLDVGAIVQRYPASTTVRSGKNKVALEATSIDLGNSNDDNVLQADFFDFAPSILSKGKGFDSVVLSLVVNFVGDPRLRAKMLTLCRKLLNDSRAGLLFLVLPAACVENSRYMTCDLLGQILKSCGFVSLSTKFSGNGKLYFVVCQKDDNFDFNHPYENVKRQLCHMDNKSYNNFSIIVQAGSDQPVKVEEFTGSKRKKSTSNQRKRNRKKMKKNLAKA